MADHARDYLFRQFETAWKLTSFHLDGLTTEECLWRPATEGLHVRQAADGRWRADWPEHEGYDLGPPSIGWLTWHLGFWWSMVLNHSFGDGTHSREEVRWPGSGDGVREGVGRLHGEWRGVLERITDAELASAQRTRWPFQNRPFGDVVAWVNVELTKNAAEIGYARFLYAVRGRLEMPVACDMTTIPATERGEPEAPPGGGPVSLRLEGPPGTGEFLRAELHLPPAVS